MSGKYALILVTACFLCGLFTSLPALEIPLGGREYEGFARRAEVFTLGLPLPQGAVSDPSVLRVTSAAGAPLPAQFETTSTWPDGSVRWLLVDFTADCPAGGSANFVLRDSGPAAEFPLLAVREDGRNVVVETGVLRCEIDREHFDLFGRVWLDHDRDGAFSDAELVTPVESPAGIQALDALGRRLDSRSGPVKSFTVEAGGPLRATIAVKGSLYEESTDGQTEARVDYTARLHFYAGSGLVRVFFTLENHSPTTPLPDRDGDPSHWVMGREGSFFFDDLSLVTRLRFGGPIELSVGDGREDILDRVGLTGPGGVYQESSGGENWFHRNHANHLGRIPLTFRGAEYFLDGTDAYTRNRPDAWLQACDRSFGLAVAVRHFWQNFPKCLSAAPDGSVRVALWPEEFPDHHELEGGEIKTHEVAFYFHTGRQGSTPAENRIATVMGAFHHPLVVRPEASVYLAGGFFEDAAVFDPRRFPEYENLMHGALVNPENNLTKDSETIDEYGWRNFGDTWAKNEIDQTGGPHTGRIVISHYNQEYDHGYGMLFQSLRTLTGGPDISYRWWRMAEAGLRHESDIDLYHSQAKSPRDGVHDGGKFTHTQHGVEAAQVGHRGGPRLTWFGKLRWPWGEGSNPESGHFNNRGLLALYYLTGDRRVLESAEMIRDLVYWKITENRFAQIDQPIRDAGNNLQIMTDAYLQTWDGKYRQAAEKILIATAPDSQWFLTDSGCRANPDKAVDGFWSTAICLNSAARFTDAVELADGRRYELGRQYVIRYADFVATDLAAGPDVGFYSRWTPASGGSGRGYGAWTYRISDVAMWGHKFSDDSQVKKRCLTAARDAFAYMKNQYPAASAEPVYLNSKSNTIVTGGGHQYTAYIQNGGWK